MNDKPPQHILDHDVPPNTQDMPPIAPELEPNSQPESAVQSLDVIRQDKSKLVEEEYRPKEWAKPKLDQIKATSSLNVNTSADPATVTIKDNVVSMKIHTYNDKSKEMETEMQLLFFKGGILKIYCRNPANPSKFSLEMIDKPDVTPFQVHGKVNVQKEGLEVEMEGNTKLVVGFDPFIVTVVSTIDEPDEALFRMNTNKSMLFDDNLTADFTFHTEYIYGIPERAHTLLLEDTKVDLPYRLFNLDIFGYSSLSKNGLYGCAPMLITRKKDKPKWASIFWQNAAETYVEVHKAKDTSDVFWISERGNLELYVFTHHHAIDHYKAISDVVGRSAMPQYFSLGYHQCRYSYLDHEDVVQVNEKFNEHEIPCDSITLDIDHTDDMRYFTWNHNLYPNPLELQKILEKDRRKLITIADPHIKVDPKYPVYQGATLKDLCVKDNDNKTFVGECWPGKSVYLDYLNEETLDYWASLYSYENYPGSSPSIFAWNDMNEPSVFEEKDKTLPKDALHTIKSHADPEAAFQVQHREVHNLYGYAMSKATYAGLLRRNKDQNIRPHALSRSFFAGSQRWCTVWTGDSLTSWEHLRVSVPMLLSMSLCGLSFVGSDVGGFVGDPEPELLVRWYQLGTFMPYFRGHSDKRYKRREPWLYPKASLELIKEAIRERYRLLPYIYTCFEDHCRTGKPILRPTWLDREAIRTFDTMRDEERFMVGDSLLVEPILESGKYGIKDPLQGMHGRWYDYYTKREILPDEEIMVGIERIGCYLKGGKGIPLFEVLRHMKSSKDVKEGNINLYIGLDEYGTAEGRMYFDDGETFNYKKGSFMRKRFEFKKDMLVWQDLERPGFTPSNRVTKAIIMGADNEKFSKAYLQGEGGERQSVNLVKSAGCLVLEFVAAVSRNWRILLH